MDKKKDHKSEEQKAQNVATQADDQVAHLQEEVLQTVAPRS